MSGYGTKRNEFQRVQDRHLTIERLQQGRTYQQIAAEISETRPYTLSYQQVIRDLEPVKLEAIAKINQCMEEIIAEELEEIEKVLKDAWDAINAEPKLIETTKVEEHPKHGKIITTSQQWINVKKDASLLATILKAAARRSELLGVNIHLKYLDDNAMFEAARRMGYKLVPESEEN